MGHKERAAEAFRLAMGGSGAAAAANAARMGAREASSFVASWAAYAADPLTKARSLPFGGRAFTGMRYI